MLNIISECSLVIPMVCDVVNISFSLLLFELGLFCLK